MPYTIGEAAQRMQLNPPTLRYYDKEGLLPFVDRSASGIRLFKESDFEWLQLIECLKATGMSIKEIKQFIDWYQEGDTTLEQRKQMFHERKAAVEKQLKAMQDMMDIVNYKCWFYDKAVEVGSADIVKAMDLDNMPSNIRNGKEKLSKWHCTK